jgi:hypothetical protein
MIQLNAQIFEKASEKSNSLTKDEVNQKWRCYLDLLLNTLDAIWKYAPSIEKDLVPTDSNIQELDTLLH